ncbi:unnamed protein product [Trichobilharzia regenti]|nr:unnamed protein product [Trichobilharzia regenti]
MIDGSGCVYSISLNSSLCLSEINTDAAVDYREYKILQRVYETLEQHGNNLTLGGIPSGPAAFPAFISLNAFKTSAFVGGLASTCSCVCVVGISGQVAGGGRFKSTLK